MVLKSSVEAAQAAVSQIKVGEGSGQHFDLGETNISGIKQAVTISNQIVNDINQLETGIKQQADKFPKLASVIEERDRQDATNISQMNWGF